MLSSQAASRPPLQCFKWSYFKKTKNKHLTSFRQSLHILHESWRSLTGSKGQRLSRSNVFWIPKPLIFFFSRGKLKVEDDQGQIVCTLRGGRKMEREGEMVAWRPQLGWNRILTYISAFFGERKQLLPSCSWQVVKVLKVVGNISGWDGEN